MAARAGPPPPAASSARRPSCSAWTAWWNLGHASQASRPPGGGGSRPSTRPVHASSVRATDASSSRSSPPPRPSAPGMAFWRGGATARCCCRRGPDRGRPSCPRLRRRLHVSSVLGRFRSAVGGRTLSPAPRAGPGGRLRRPLRRRSSLLLLPTVLSLSRSSLRPRPRCLQTAAVPARRGGKFCLRSRARPAGPHHQALGSRCVGVSKQNFPPSRDDGDAQRGEAQAALVRGGRPGGGGTMARGAVEVRTGFEPPSPPLQPSSPLPPLPPGPRDDDRGLTGPARRCRARRRGPTTGAAWRCRTGGGSGGSTGTC